MQGLRKQVQEGERSYHALQAQVQTLSQQTEQLKHELEVERKLNNEMSEILDELRQPEAESQGDFEEQEGLDMR
jgi:CHASE3 domain sensor protein